MREALQGHFGPDGFFLAAVAGEPRLRQEIFYLGYHLHWPYGELMDMPINERREYVKLLAEQVERENKTMENAARGRRS